MKLHVARTNCSCLFYLELRGCCLMPSFPFVDPGSHVVIRWSRCVATKKKGTCSLRFSMHIRHHLWTWTRHVLVSVLLSWYCPFSMDSSTTIFVLRLRLSPVPIYGHGLRIRHRQGQDQATAAASFFSPSCFWGGNVSGCGATTTLGKIGLGVHHQIQELTTDRHASTVQPTSNDNKNKCDLRLEPKKNKAWMQEKGKGKQVADVYSVCPKIKVVLVLS